MNVLLAPVAVLGLAILGATRQMRLNGSNSPSLNFSSKQAPPPSGSSERGALSLISQPA